MTRSELMALVAVRKAEIEAHETDLVEVLTTANPSPVSPLAPCAPCGDRKSTRLNSSHT